MILHFNEEAFNLNGKTELLDDNGTVLYYGIYDFSYKKRIRIFDVNNNEVAYIQFKVTSDEDKIGFYSKDNKLISYIPLTKDLNNVYLKDDDYKYVIDNEGYKLIDKNNNEIMHVGNLQADIKDNDNILKCVMCLFVFSNIEEISK